MARNKEWDKLTKKIKKLEAKRRKVPMRDLLPIGVSINHAHRKHPSWKTKFRAQIKINGKQVYLGLFSTIEEASKAYQDKLLEKR